MKYEFGSEIINIYYNGTNDGNTLNKNWNLNQSDRLNPHIKLIGLKI